jgi:dienelactone hydrolase
MEQQEVAYAVDGLSMRGVLVDGSGGKPRPGVVIEHEAIGLDPRMVIWAQKLALAGYVERLIWLFRNSPTQFAPCAG